MPEQIDNMEIRNALPTDTTTNLEPPAPKSTGAILEEIRTYLLALRQRHPALEAEFEACVYWRISDSIQSETAIGVEKIWYEDQRTWGDSHVKDLWRKIEAKRWENGRMIKSIVTMVLQEHARETESVEGRRALRKLEVLADACVG